MERLYRVEFDTQSNRRFISWGFYVSANNNDDDTDIEAALDSLYFRLDTDVKINVHSYEFQED